MLFDRRALFGGFMVWERRFDPARRIQKKISLHVDLRGSRTSLGQEHAST
jgi:hypothetical protein